MRTRCLVACALLLAGGAAMTQDLPTVEVRAGSLETVTVPCAQPDSVTPQDVERVLSLEDSSMTRDLRKKLIGAVSDACKAGVPHILVARGPNGTLNWKQAE
ncbi:MAG: hypothetical protein ACTHKZ_01980 [Lysobacteraceae bacterium]